MFTWCRLYENAHLMQFISVDSGLAHCHRVPMPFENAMTGNQFAFPDKLHKAFPFAADLIHIERFSLRR
jgi:hypothetical protein